MAAWSKPSPALDCPHSAPGMCGVQISSRLQNDLLTNGPPILSNSKLASHSQSSRWLFPVYYIEGLPQFANPAKVPETIYIPASSPHRGEGSTKAVCGPENYAPGQSGARLSWCSAVVLGCGARAHPHYQPSIRLNFQHIYIIISYTKSVGI